MGHFIHCYQCGGNAFLCSCFFAVGKEPPYLQQIRKEIQAKQKAEKEKKLRPDTELFLRLQGRRRVRMLQFSYDGYQYAIDFQRAHRPVEVLVKPSRWSRERVKKTQKSKYPYTTVNIHSLDPKGKGIADSTIVASATVGCLPSDRFSPEKGRIEALRKLMGNVDPAVRPKIWDAYFSRLNAIPKNATEDLVEGTIVSEAVGVESDEFPEDDDVMTPDRMMVG